VLRLSHPGLFRLITRRRAKAALAAMYDRVWARFNGPTGKSPSNWRRTFWRIWRGRRD
jgi:hypothetical protein